MKVRPLSCGYFMTLITTFQTQTLRFTNAVFETSHSRTPTYVSARYLLSGYLMWPSAAGLSGKLQFCHPLQSWNGNPVSKIQKKQWETCQHKQFPIVYNIRHIPYEIRNKPPRVVIQAKVVLTQTAEIIWDEPQPALLPLLCYSIQFRIHVTGDWSRSLNSRHLERFQHFHRFCVPTPSKWLLINFSE